MTEVVRPQPADRVPAQVLLLGSITSVQFGSAFAAKLFAQAGPGGAVFLRLLLSGAVLLLIARPKVRSRSRRDLVVVAMFGLVLGSMNWSFYQALDRLPLGVAVTVEFMGPLALAVAASRRLVDAVWVALAAGGVALLALRGDRSDISATGIVLALIAGACWAAYITLAKRVGTMFATLDGLALALAVGTLVALPAGLVQGGTALLRPGVLAGGALVALLSSIIPYSLEILALRRLSAGYFGLLMSLEPAFAALAGVIVLSESLSAVLVVALMLVVVASVGSSITPRGRAEMSRPDLL